jgi:hypothetical protein
MKRGIEPPSPEDSIARQMEVNKQTREEAIATMRHDEFWENNLYYAGVNRFKSKSPFMPSVHLALERRDHEIVRDWRHIQWIKNDILGENVEAYEIFPAESRLVDTANVYHLWAFPAGYRIPVPIAMARGRMVVNDATNQRAFE